MYYKIFHDDQATKQTDNDYTDSETTMPIKLEKLVKQFKIHRCAIDFDMKFLKVLFKEELGTNL